MELREELLGLMECTEKNVTIRGKRIKVKAVTVEKRLEILATASEMVGDKNDVDGRQFMSYVHLLTFIDSVSDPETDKPIFGRKDVQLLKKKMFGTIERVAGIINQMSGVEVGSQEEAEKN